MGWWVWLIVLELVALALLWLEYRVAMLMPPWDGDEPPREG